MKIRSKLAWTFSILMIIGISAVCSYAIIYIKSYIKDKGVKQFKQNTRSLAVSVANLPASSHFRENLDEITKSSGYQLMLYDSSGALIYSYPSKAKAVMQLSTAKRKELKTRGNLPWMPEKIEQGEKLISFSYLPQSLNQARYIRVSQFKDLLFAPVKK